MLQKEVVDHGRHAAGSKDYGRLSVMLQWRQEVESLIDVAARSSIRHRGWIQRWCGWVAAAPAALVTVAFSQRRRCCATPSAAGSGGRERADFDLQRRAEEGAGGRLHRAGRSAVAPP